MNRSVPFVLAVVVAALALIGPAATASAAVPTASITAPIADSVFTDPPEMTFTATGGNLLQLCALVGPGVEVYSPNCVSGYKPRTTLADGTYTYRILASNDDGSALAERSFMIDTSAPVINFTSGPADGAWTNADVVTMAVSVSDTTPLFLDCRIDMGSWSPCTGSATAGSITWASIPHGGHSFSFRAMDRIGHTTEVKRTVWVDRILPTASIAIVGGGGLTDNPRPSFQLSAADDSGLASRTCRIFNVTPAENCDSDQWQPAQNLADGDYSAELTAVDKGGNSVTAKQSFSVDTTAPVISFVGPTGDRTTNTTPSVSFTVDDAHLTTSRCGFDAPDPDKLEGCGAGVGHAPAAALSFGAHSFSVASSDVLGNSSTAVYSFTVVDPASGGQGGENPPPAAAAKIALKAKSGRAARGRFRLSVTVTVSGTESCGRATLKLQPKLKRAKTMKASVKTMARNGSCSATKKLTLSSKLKKKRATLTVQSAGLSRKLTVRL